MTESSVSNGLASDHSRGSMHRLIRHLIQLQDLQFAHDQSEIASANNHLEQLDASIQTMLNELPLEVRSQFTKLHKKGGLGIVPISGGVCSACGMQIPVSQVHAVHAGDILYQCPSCARYLFFPESLPRRLSQRRKRGEPAQVGLARFSAPALMMPNLAATDRDEVIAEMCGKLGAEGFVDHAARLAEEALKREAIASTAVDHGLAFPHVRGVEGGGLTMALGLSRKGIRFGGSGKNSTRIVFLMVIPTAASAFYLRLLAGLNQTFQNEDARDSLFKAETPEDLWKMLTKATRLTIP